MDCPNVLIGSSEFREITSGRRRGVGASLARAALAALEVPYSVAVGWRNHRYDCRRVGTQRGYDPRR